MDDLIVTRSDAAQILVVDDDIQLVRGLRTALEHYGYVVRAVERAAQAPEVAAQFQPDLVLLDVMMPDVDGWEVLRRLRGSASTQTIPVIMLTASGTDAAKVKGFTIGADDYMTKPFSLQELRCRIEAVLRRTRVHEEAEPRCTIPVLVGTAGHAFLNAADVYFAEGIRNYTYIHTSDGRHLSRLSLGALDDRHIDDYVRIHRSFIVNMNHVAGCRWANKSSYRLRLGDLAQTEIPVSRSLVAEIQTRLGLRA